MGVVINKVEITTMVLMKKHDAIIFEVILCCVFIFPSES